MMYIEELIDRLACNGNFLFNQQLVINNNDWNIVYSLSEQIQRGNAYTEKQRGLAIRIVTKYAYKLAEENIIVDVLNPQFKMPARVLSDAKTITIKTTADRTMYIAVRFPYSQLLIDTIKEHKKHIPYTDVGDGISWNNETKEWDFDLTEENIKFVGTIQSGFETDELFSKLLKDIQDIEAHFEDYVPIVTFEDGKFIYKNVMTNLPQPGSTDVVEVLLHARQHGITTWDDAIDIALQSINPTVYNFLKTPTGEILMQPEFVSLSAIKDIIGYSGNVLFVIPGGTELDHLTYAHEYLLSDGYDNSQMTVMFRLDSSSGKICNDYIRQHKVNTPLSDDIKFVFISRKIPKPLIESGKQFDLVVHFGTNSAHYTLKDYIKNHHNVVSMHITSNQKELHG